MLFNNSLSNLLNQNSLNESTDQRKRNPNDIYLLNYLSSEGTGLKPIPKQPGKVRNRVFGKL